MVKKILGYILSLAGIIGLAIPYIPQLKKAIPLPSTITPYLTVISIILVSIGIFFIMQAGSSKGKQAKEVPIFRGKNVVGYRQTR